MERIKRYKTLDEFLSYKDRGQTYEGYVIGYGYAFYEPVAIKPPHLMMNDSIYPSRVPYDMSFFQTMWQQNLDRSLETIMESFGDNYEYLYRSLVNQQNGTYYINMGNGEILEVPVENTTISINMDSSGKFTLSVKSSSAQGSIERMVAIDLRNFHVIFGNQGKSTYLTNAAKQLGCEVYKNSDTFEFGLDDGIGVIGTAVGFRGNIPHNELFWKQQNGRWNNRIATRGNYVYNRSYQLKGQRLAGWKVGGTALGIASAGALIYDVASTGEVSTSDGINAFMIGISFSGWGAIVSGLWFVADVGTGLITGKSISDRIDENTGSVTLWETNYN